MRLRELPAILAMFLTVSVMAPPVSAQEGLVDRVTAVEELEERVAALENQPRILGQGVMECAEIRDVSSSWPSKPTCKGDFTLKQSSGDYEIFLSIRYFDVGTNPPTWRLRVNKIDGRRFELILEVARFKYGKIDISWIAIGTTADRKEN